MIITVGELRDQLNHYSDDTEISFGCTVAAVPLVFYRVKTRGEKLVQIELNEDFPEPGEYKVIVDKSMGHFQIDAPHIGKS